MLAELIATLCAGFFAGAAIYITLVEHPARLECGTALAATEFGPSYRRATIMQASLAAVGFLAALAAWAQGAGPAVLLGGIVLGLVIPFTLIVILPTNKRLLDPTLDRGSPEAAALLERWGRLHAVRSVASGIAFGLLAWDLARMG
jgi:anthrone oxygenase-like protein